MKHYAGLDVSLKVISICVVDGEGKTIARGNCPADPEGVMGWFRNRSLAPQQIVHESGMLSIWLQRGMVRLGLPATCIDARKAHKSLSARLNKSDAGDAEGLAQLARTGWFTPVHVRSEGADRLRVLVGARERLIRLRKDLEGHIRGVLKTFGIRMTGNSQGRQRQAFRDQLAAAGETDPLLRAIADGFIATHATLCQAAADLDTVVKKKARDHPVARRLMAIPGVGPVVSLNFIALVDEPARFRKTADVGAYLGLTNAETTPIRRGGLVGPGVEMRRRSHAEPAVRGRDNPDHTSAEIFGAEKLGCPTCRPTRLREGGRGSCAKTCRAHVDNVEERNRVHLENGGRCLT